MINKMIAYYHHYYLLLTYFGRVQDNSLYRANYKCWLWLFTSDEVGSKKYIVGAQRGLALQTTAWIDRVWDTTQHELKHALSIAEEFRTPIFANLTITTSGLAEDEKAEVTKLIQDNGGTYTGKLTKANTHLVSN